MTARRAFLALAASLALLVGAASPAGPDLEPAGTAGVELVADETPSTTSSTPPPPVTPPSVWTFGDSITFGTWLADPASQSWPARLDELMGPGVQVRNLGVGGQAVAYGDCAGCERMDALVRRKLAATPAAELPRVIVFAGGINDMIRATDVSPTRTAVYDLGVWIAQNYPGVKFFVTTLTPYASDATYAGPLSERRATYNAWVRAMYPGGSLVDVGEVLTAGPTYADPRYYLDGLHPDAEGAGLYADGVFAVLKVRGAI